jgi:hypothetical protein
VEGNGKASYGENGKASYGEKDGKNVAPVVDMYG